MPQVSIEFDIVDADAVQVAAAGARTSVVRELQPSRRRRDLALDIYSH